MEVRFEVGKFTFNVEGVDEKDVFEKIANLQEIFGQVYVDPKTGDVDDELFFSVRQVDDNKYYEVVSKKFGKRLQFGKKKKDSSLFPKKWVDVWQGSVEDEDEEEAAPTPPPKKSGKGEKTPF